MYYLTERGILATSSEEDEDEEAEDKAEREDIKIKEAEQTKNQTESEDQRIKRYRELLLGVDKKSSTRKQREGDLEFDWEGGDLKEEGFNELLFDRKKSKGLLKFQLQLNLILIKQYYLRAE